MALQINRRREPGCEIIRVIRAEIAAARRLSSSRREDVAERIHHARAACKRIRAVLRLIRESCPDLYARENSWFRDSGRRLARLRDADVMLACLRDLSRQPVSGRKGAAFFVVARQRLLERRKNEGRNDSARELARFGRRLRNAEFRLVDERLEPVSFAALLEGFTKTYRRARQAMPEGVASKSDCFHSWRKQTKSCGYQCRLLRDICPREMNELWRRFDKLGKVLGAEHDLSMLRKFLRDSDAPGISVRLAVAGLRLIDRRRDEQRRAALALGRKLFADRPRDFGRRLQRWHQSGRDVSA